MKISHYAHKRFRNFLYKRPVQHGVVSDSPLERFTSTLGTVAVPAAVALSTAATAAGSGALAILGIAPLALVCGGVAGGFVGSVIHHGLNEILGITDSLAINCDGRLGRKIFRCGLAAAVGCAVAGLGGAPATAALLYLGGSALLSGIRKIANLSIG